ncbi:hypothetical protein GYA28_03780 [Candidatus Roizmanbacteria bacterium]|nr:hypothetical protein [Candidatus Roizmanbacteria bacterium]
MGRKKSGLYKTVIFLFVFFQFSYIFFAKAPISADTASLTSASVTLTNNRMSFKGGITASPESAGATTVTIDSTGSDPDRNTANLFPNDTVCFTDSGENGCKGNRSYTVNTIPGGVTGTTFTMSPSLTTDLASSDYVVASQSGSMQIAFTTANTVPIGGSIYITIPAVDSTKTNDGLPDSNSSIATNGFDANGLQASDITVTGCTDAYWSKAFSVGDASNDHRITLTRTDAVCAASSAITVTIPDLVNPAPIQGSNNQGQADVYTVSILTRDGSNNTIDEVNADVAAIEGVLVSATVKQTITFTVAGVTTATTTCGAVPDIESTATTVPFDVLTATNQFYNISQKLSVSTNADAGYNVKVEELDQMGRNGAACTGTTPAADGYTFGSSTCIRDTVCDGGACDETSGYEDDWETATNNGLGYSLKNFSGNDAAFQHNVVSGNCTGTADSDFCAKQLPDTVGSETKQTIMSNNAPVSSSSVYVCYRLSISGTQPAGYYYNKVRYTATATF